MCQDKDDRCRANRESRAPHFGAFDRISVKLSWHANCSIFRVVRRFIGFRNMRTLTRESCRRRALGLYKRQRRENEHVVGLQRAATRRVSPAL